MSSPQLRREIGGIGLLMFSVFLAGALAVLGTAAGVLIAVWSIEAVHALGGGE